MVFLRLLGPWRFLVFSFRVDKHLLFCFLSTNENENTSYNIFDSTPPVLFEIVPVITPTGNTLPSYVFSSSENGTIQYYGSCSSSTMNAQLDNNTIIAE